MNGHHDASLVALALIVAVAGAYTSLDLARRSRHSAPEARRYWLAAAGVALGGGIWSMHRVRGAPFVIFCDYFLRAVTRIDGRTLSLKIDGEDNHVARFALVRTGRAALPEVIVRKLSGEVISATTTTANEICYDVPPYTGLVLSWSG